MNSTFMLIGIVMVCVGVTLYINLNLLNKLKEKLDAEKKRLILEISSISMPEDDQHEEDEKIPSFTPLSMLEELRN